MAGDQANRLTSGGLIDRSTALSFRFDGKTLLGFKGDTLASALVANGVKLVGRSFKYHRPRGILTAGSEEPNALVELRSGARREPNTKATTAELYEGLEAASQNRWPSLNFDVMSVNQLFAPIFVAGFYYKTFMWPAKFWEAIYEPAIRRAAGLGRAAGVSDPDHYDKAWAHCDVVIAGSGPAGLAAALAAGRSGARVILCEEDFVLGGRLLADGGPIDGLPAAEWVARAVAELTVMPDVRIMTRTSLFGVYDGGTYGAIERVNDHLPVPPEHQVRQRLWRIVAKRCVVAAGAIERPIVFAGNDTPGVMMASAMRSYINRYAATPARHIAVFTNNEDGWRTAETAIAAGLQVAAVIDARPDVSPAHRSLASKGGFPVLHGSVSAVDGGKTGVRKISVSLTGGARAEVEADGLAVSGGWNPAVGLTSYHRGRPKWRDDIAAFVPDGAPPGMVAAGAANGAFGLGACLREGFEAGAAAARDAGRGGNIGSMPVADDAAFSLTPLWHVAGKGKAFVDQQHDVTASDVELAQREGFQSVEHLKRYTTLGMATDQGKTSNVAGLAIMAAVSGKSIPETGTTIYRPPYVPVAIGAFAGHHRDENFHATRLTPSHHWAAEQGAVFVDTGLWKRAQWYPRAGEKDWLESVTREVKAVRSSVGFCDVSTLGKIDVHGPDAGAFLDRVYINAFSSLAVGKARYGLMLREDGIVYDDGTTSRLAEDHYFLTTTTAKAGLVMQHLEFCRQVLFPELDVQLTSVSDQWAQFSIAGPKTRDLLKEIVDPAEDLSNEGFPFMGAREVKLRGGLKARLFRISFSGEMAFEISVPARYGEAMARNLMIAGEPFGVTPYGTEALGVMRIEKGHVAGPELSGTTTAGDLGLGKMMSTKKDFIGRVMAGREALVALNRQVVVGIKPTDKARRLRSGAHIIPKGETPGPENDQGYVTSVCFSPVLDQWIGLGLVERGRERIGETVRAHDPLRSEDYDVELCSPVFYDPDGGRQRG
ncbi:sarcosine oxidase subunit alpha family protein [Mesorhizobium sp. M2A.F.Ca.ET.037.01.1.1]|uniref:sarcosine oxidase subunit alpha n=6 Tax=Mesorhizobium TaxID=68287 RepID=UPI000F75497E|nr:MULTISPECIES: sarcosine oxidase subunit alpha [unclassified Mesorhizobium]RVC74896.1 sarcosine oxidase subunit alpha family protein [Mesorhizobium sp. M2A.F.Ca.ET.046.02.1.1]AZO33789.1 sarcosine oxidase subunit alpha [Mesorhizobium sp. M2A.F.Ca.ET.046.03.2.1]RUX17843.1 sarcosine oxidase subunit alpha family protein [Mesorhizobium sp. M2A.F.Ca.ET.037.01.1.1]RWA80686.1 MAG: sarcosine oxidase subunit alpha family protein [Mesorhizobium sp.]RWB37438.1 MAG: sarcosine oxidase subunit alpha family